LKIPQNSAKNEEKNGDNYPENLKPEDLIAFYGLFNGPILKVAYSKLEAGNVSLD